MKNPLQTFEIIPLSVGSPAADGELGESQVTSEACKPAQGAGARLASIDALRGVAALGVTLFHGLDSVKFLLEPAFLASFSGVIFALIGLLLSYGYTGVILFFLISGFCIHLRWAKAKGNGQANPTIDFIPFWKRRIRRLYPAYLAALAIYLVVTIWLGHTPASWFTVYDTVIHLLMLHNLDNRTCYSINGVFWTLAIEEQLYLAYFLLLALRKRLGWMWTLALVFVCRLGWFGLGLTVHRLFNWDLPASESALSNWFVWALGAVSVEAMRGVIKLPRWCYNVPLGSVFLLLAAVLDYLDRGADSHSRLHHFVWLFNMPIWGIGFFFVLNRVTSAEAGWRKRSAASGLPGLIRWASALGVFSYSLYLTHELAVIYPGAALGAWLHLSFEQLAVVRWVLLVPLSLVLARVFFELFEKPYLTPQANAGQ